MPKKFKIGPLQEKWLRQLELHPERKTKGILGKKNRKGNIKACCLGQALICLRRFEGGKAPFNERGKIVDVAKNKDENTATLEYSYKKLGLRGEGGSFGGKIEDIEKGENAYNIKSLADMNDESLNGKPVFTWPDIAKFIRENPTVVFTKSV